MVDEQKIRQLREDLRLGRASETSSDIGTNDRDDDSASGTTFQDARGAIEHLTRDSTKVDRNNQQSGSNGRSIETKPKRKRFPNRRSGEDHSGTTPDTTANADREVGRLTTDEPIPIRNVAPEADFDKTAKKRQPKDKGPTGGGKTTEKVRQVFSGGKVLSNQEAEEYKESLTEALASDFEYLDQYLWLRFRGLDKEYDKNEPVWSNVDKDEITAITRILLKRGKTNPAAATVVRAIVDSSDYIAVGMIFAPRIIRTVEIVRETRKPRQGRKAVTI